MLERLEAARALHEIGRRLQIAGGEPYRARVFLRGAAAIQAQPASLRTLLGERRLRSLRGIGPALAGGDRGAAPDRPLGAARTAARRDAARRARAVANPAEPPAHARARSRRSASPASRSSRRPAAPGASRRVRGFGPAPRSGCSPPSSGCARATAGSTCTALSRQPTRSWRTCSPRPTSRGPTSPASCGGGQRRSRACRSWRREPLPRRPPSGCSRSRSWRRSRPHEPEGTAAILTNGVPVRLAWAEPGRYGTLLVERTGSEAHWLQARGARARARPRRFGPRRRRGARGSRPLCTPRPAVDPAGAARRSGRGRGRARGEPASAGDGRRRQGDGPLPHRLLGRARQRPRHGPAPHAGWA